MHLSYSFSKYKGKKYKSYAIAESYREGKKVKKRTIWPIGKLTDQQAEKIRMVCKVAKNQEQLLDRFNDIVVKESRAYLDIAVVNALWNFWQMDHAFNFEVTNSALSTSLIAKILTINRCTEPCSHYSIPYWAAHNALGEVLGIDLKGLNDDKIYYELDKIHHNHVHIENHLFQMTYGKDPQSYRYIDYDLTTSYFVGYRCQLSAFGKGKLECHGRRQVLLGVLINQYGYPFKWDVFPGNTAEVKTLKRNINACKKRFNLDGGNVTLVFDRGIISEDNAQLIEQSGMKYISSLDRNQIPSCGIELKPFEPLSAKAPDTLPEGFKNYDSELYFHDYGAVGNKRLIVGFNPTMFAEDRKRRDEKLQFFGTYLSNENKGLEHAKRDRQADATSNRVQDELKRLKIKKYFEPPRLTPIKVAHKLKDGVIRQVESYHIEVERKNDVIHNDRLLDGVCVFVTNHTERQGRGFKVSPHRIIQAYREKTKVEDVFKNIKSFLKIRPFFVNNDNHVRAVYTICILAYFLNRYLSNLRQTAGEKDFLNSKELYAPFKDIDYVTLFDKSTAQSVKKLVELPEKTKTTLQKIGLEHLAATRNK